MSNNKVIILFVLIAAIKKKFSDATDKQIRDRLGRILAQSKDRDGGRKERELSKGVRVADADGTN